MEQGGTTDLFDLPECCIVDILSRICTSPRDACRLSVVSSFFRSAADSDSIWERFLPFDMQLILSSSVSHSLLNFSSKKEQFLHLCDNPLLIDNGTKTFTLEKCSGKKCFMIRAKELCIVWGDRPMDWNWPSLPESRFSEVAELVDSCLLDFHYKTETRLLSPNTTYVVYLVFKLTALAYGLENESVQILVKLADGGRSEQGVVRRVRLQRSVERKWEGELPEETKVSKRRWRSKFPFRGWRLPLSRQEDRVPTILEYIRYPSSWGTTLSRSWGVPMVTGSNPKERGDGWMEIEMGEFFNERGEYGVDIILMDPTTGHGKSGLIIQGMELRPKVNQ
ncbi:hypothetical protein NE237_013902 [Protea cynaroides]|uniref:F-box domain-containing protein n=1 Tax=Protea cynaroides TaxID=273540 RepID=A0A9Q0H0S6_9MAGN|nr:hypothetical protein NE237_013902 [Protea cynaroides]